MQILLDALNSTLSIRQAAKKLGLSHTALLRKIQKYPLLHKKGDTRWGIVSPRQ
jgi:transcriptional regulator of aroF, aroG, tyrA and aromatic amino acid transport